MKKTHLSIRSSPTQLCVALPSPSSVSERRVCHSPAGFGYSDRLPLGCSIACTDSHGYTCLWRCVFGLIYPICHHANRASMFFNCSYYVEVVVYGTACKPYQKSEYQAQRGGSVVESACCFCQEPEFCSQHACGASHNHALLHLQRTRSLFLNSMNICTRVRVPTDRHTYTHSFKVVLCQAVLLYELCYSQQESGIDLMKPRKSKPPHHDLDLPELCCDPPPKPPPKPV